MSYSVLALQFIALGIACLGSYGFRVGARRIGALLLWIALLISLIGLAS